jgi:hypothetical protein
MKSQLKRTLVKSPPELWELADDVPRMEGWMAGLVGTPNPVPVTVTDRDPRRVLAWRASGADVNARVELRLTETGFGTSVSITVDQSHTEQRAADAVLEQLLDDLGSPERRPFARR